MTALLILLADKKFCPDVEMRISGGGIQHYRVGQAASLVCRVRGLTSPPLALYWERGNKVISILELQSNHRRSVHNHVIYGIASMSQFHICLPYLGGDGGQQAGQRAGDREAERGVQGQPPHRQRQASRYRYSTVQYSTVQSPHSISQSLQTQVNEKY